MHQTPYSTLISAKQACVTKGTACTGVYDSSCDDQSPFYLCKNSDFSASSGSCIYVYAPTGVYKCGYSHALYMSVHLSINLFIPPGCVPLWVRDFLYSLQ